MKTINLLLFFVALSSNSIAQTNWYWAKQATGLPSQEGGNVIVDKNNNVYATGGIITIGVPPNGGYDTSYFGSKTVLIPTYVFMQAYLIRYDDHGNVIWVKTANGGPYSSSFLGYSAADKNGNIYAGGNYTGIVGWGTTTITSRDTLDGVLVKFDSSGAILWADDIGGCDYLQGVAVDNTSNVYVTGFFRDTLYIGSNIFVGDTNGDMFVAKFNTAGNLIWARTAADSGINQGTGISIDNLNNIYVSGNYKGHAITFGTKTLTSIDSTAIFIVKYDTNGNVLMAETPQGFHIATATSNTTDYKNNFYLAGQFDSIYAKTDTFANPAKRTSLYVAKFDTGGNMLWVNAATGTQLNNYDDRGTYPYSLATDTSGHLYVAASSGDTITMGTFVLSTYQYFSPYSYQPSCVIKLNDSTGLPLCGMIMPCGGDDESGVAVDKQENVIFEGDIENNDTFGPYNLIATNGETEFIIKFSCDAPFDAINPIASGKEQINVYPNPFNTTTTISFSQPIEKHFIEVDDVTGRKLKYGECNDKEYLLSRAGLAAGVYMVKVSDNSNNVVAITKVVVY